MFSRNAATVTLLAVLAGVSVFALAGDGYGFKCPNEKCGFKPTVVFGGGMLFEQAQGWCHKCQAFRNVTWTRPGAPPLNADVKPKPQPKPLAEVWVPASGQVRKVYKCPSCADGSFIEILKPEELCRCPKCNSADFKVDPNAPRLAVD